ncbi:peptidase of plants and bacteria-domain-containing protein [Suillus spraguei]|nr:peptidase of plants and bacteria-domain-containing protein [Suillus spraguei]
MPPHDLPPQSTWIIPNFVLRVEDLSHPGASIFFDCVKPKEALKLAVEASYTWLYTPLTAPTHVKTITLVLRPFDGVAYTFGTHETKEINFSLDWIKSSEARAQDEILGHTCPGGLIEGIADFVRLHAGFAPPHWRPRAAEKWDAGTIRRLNGSMKDSKYGVELFEKVAGESVSSLYTLYCEHLETGG